LKENSRFRLWIIAVEHNKSVVGIAPLIIVEEQNRFIKWRSLQLFAVGDYGDFLVDSNCDVKLERIYKEIFKAIEMNDALWDEISIHHLAHLSPLTMFILSSKYNNNCQPLVENPQIEICIPGCYINAPKNTNNYRNALFRKSKYDFLVVSHPDFSELAELHRKERDYLRQKGRTERRSVFDDNSWLDVISNASISRDLVVYQMRSSTGLLIGYRMGFLHNNTLFSFNTAYSPDYADSRVGTVLMYEIIESNMRTNLWLRFDWGCGRYQWKFEWATGFNLLYKLYLVNPQARNLQYWRRLQSIRRGVKG